MDECQNDNSEYGDQDFPIHGFLLDHSVRSVEHRLWNRQVERFSRLQVNNALALPRYAYISERGNSKRKRLGGLGVFEAPELDPLGQGQSFLGSRSCTARCMGWLPRTGTLLVECVKKATCGLMQSSND